MADQLYRDIVDVHVVLAAQEQKHTRIVLIIPGVPRAKLCAAGIAVSMMLSASMRQCCAVIRAL